jgi:hypothetical protein
MSTSSLIFWQSHADLRPGQPILATANDDFHKRCDVSVNETLVNGECLIAVLLVVS